MSDQLRNLVRPIGEFDPPLDLHSRIIAREHELAGPRRVSWRPPRVLMIALAGAGVALVLLALALAAHSRSSAPGPAKHGPHSPALPSGWSRVDVNTGSTSSLAERTATSGSFYLVSPDHTRVAYNACCSWGTPLQVANLDGTQAEKVSAAGSSGFGEQWSPDGSLLVYQQQPDGSTFHIGNLFVKNFVTGRRTRLTNLDQTKVWGWWFLFPSFAPDGRSVLYQAPRGRANDNNRLWDLWSVPVGGGKPTLVRRNAGWGAYSPDGQSLAYVSPMMHDFNGASLWITSLSGGTSRALVRGGQLRWLRWSPDGTRIAYSNGTAIYTVDPTTGKTHKVANGGAQPEWLDNHTLIFN